MPRHLFLSLTHPSFLLDGITLLFFYQFHLHLDSHRLFHPCFSSSCFSVIFSLIPLSWFDTTHTDSTQHDIIVLLVLTHLDSTLAVLFIRCVLTVCIPTWPRQLYLVSSRTFLFWIKTDPAWSRPCYHDQDWSVKQLDYCRTLLLRQA